MGLGKHIPVPYAVEYYITSQILGMYLIHRKVYVTLPTYVQCDLHAMYHWEPLWHPLFLWHNDRTVMTGLYRYLDNKALKEMGFNMVAFTTSFIFMVIFKVLIISNFKGKPTRVKIYYCKMSTLARASLKSTLSCFINIYKCGSFLKSITKWLPSV